MSSKKQGEKIRGAGTKVWRSPALLSKINIIIIGATAETNKPFRRNSGDLSYPACGHVGLKRHANYSKYHRNRLIDIAHALCSGCGVTHALIPSFSLPDSSHDLVDMERYPAARERGETRREAGAHFMATGRDIRVLKRIERSFMRCVRNWSAIFAMALSARQAFTAITTVVAAATTAESVGVLLATNRYALEQGVNALFASRSSILLFRARKAGVAISHNLASPRKAPVAPDSS